MDLRHKHWAIIALGVLIAVFIVLILWYSFMRKEAVVPTSDTATTTLATTSPTTAGPRHITESNTYYEIDLTYPSVTPLSGDANDRAVERMHVTMQSIADLFKKNIDVDNLSHDDIQMMGLDQRKMELGSSYEMYKGARTVSYVFEIYEDTFGAHPNAYYRTLTFDIQSGAELSLDDIFSAPDYLNILSSRTRADLPLIIRNRSGYDADIEYIKAGTEPTLDSFATWFIDSRDLSIVFPPYQVGPYVLGTLIDPLSLSSLSTSLNSPYKP
jgi:hypothetical protein